MNKNKPLFRNTDYFKFLLLILVFFSCTPNQEEKSAIKFGICTDVHKDIMYDADERLESFIQDMNNQKVDFIIELGDFCFPKEENNHFLSIWNNYSGPGFHALGNHDMDISSKKETIDYLGMEHNFYSFDIKGFHFIVLDPNYFMDSVNYISYENSNYYNYGGTRGIIPPEQLSWLRDDLAKTTYPIVIFSHQGLSGSGTRRNVAEVREILETANEKAGYRKVIACFNGHHHIDDHKEINGIHYIQVNSMSYQWLGSDYAYPGRYSEEINAEYPSLKYTAPYNDPLFAVVEIRENDFLKIYGMQTEWVLPSPQDLGYSVTRMGHDTIPQISDLHLKLDK